MVTRWGTLASTHLLIYRGVSGCRLGHLSPLAGRVERQRGWAEPMSGHRRAESDTYQSTGQAPSRADQQGNTAADGTCPLDRDERKITRAFPIGTSGSDGL